MQALLSSPGSKGSSSVEDFSSPIRKSELILPASQWGLDVCHSRDSMRSPSLKARRRSRLRDRFRLAAPVQAALPDSTLSSISKSSFYSSKAKDDFSLPHDNTPPLSLSSHSEAERRMKKRGFSSEETSTTNHKRSKINPSPGRYVPLSRRRPHSDGMNKGVSHGIRRPKKKTKLKKLKRKQSPPSTKQTRSSLTNDNIARNTATPKASKASFTTPSSSSSSSSNTTKGSLLMSSEQTKVSFEIKGGQMVFRKHRDPQPSIRPPITSHHSPKAVTKLFSPSRNFLQEDSFIKTPAAAVPGSPIKFAAPSDEKENLLGLDLNDLIEHINHQCDGLTKEEESSEKEIQQIAIETEEQIRSLLDHHESMDLLVPPSKSDAGIVYSNDHDRSLVLNNISSIISNIPSIATPQPQDSQIELGDKEEEEEENGGYFAIFSKDKASSGLELIVEGECATNSKKKKTIRPDSTQMVIDAGQRVFGATLCLTCSTVYSIGDPADEENHRVIHSGLLDTISFTGWQKERVVRYLPEVGRRILMVDLEKARHWERSKVESVLSIVDKSMGSITDLNKGKSLCAFLFIADKMVVGILLAEKTEVASVHSSGDNASVHAGVSRLWVMPEYQRQGIASKLTDAFRQNYFGCTRSLKMNEFAFSLPTPDGTAFAIKYTGTEDFLMYTPPS